MLPEICGFSALYRPARHRQTNLKHHFEAPIYMELSCPSRQLLWIQLQCALRQRSISTWWAAQCAAHRIRRRGTAWPGTAARRRTPCRRSPLRRLRCLPQALQRGGNGRQSASGFFMYNICLQSNRHDVGTEVGACRRSVFKGGQRRAPTKIWQLVQLLTDRYVEVSNMYTLHSVRLRSVTEPLQGGRRG